MKKMFFKTVDDLIGNLNASKPVIILEASSFLEPGQRHNVDY